MAGRLALDFGTSNTVVALWDDAREEALPLHVGEYARVTGGVPVVPSLVHFAPDGRRWIGEQVAARGLAASPRTFRWMKRYVARQSPFKVRLEGREVSPFDAGRDFLAGVLAAAAAEAEIGDEEIAMTVPVEAFEHYEEWLLGVAEGVGRGRVRLIDEPSAAALGYGAKLQPGSAYLVFDFGGGTLDVSVVLMQEPAGAERGRRCRVLGKAGADLGGATIDGWLFQEVLRQNGRSDADDAVRSLSCRLLAECERAKELLSSQDEVVVRAGGPDHPLLQAKLTSKLLEELFDAHQLFTQIDRTVRRALNAARDRGYTEEQLEAVLMVGGSSLIPAVQRGVKRGFGPDRVFPGRPLDAVARGGAAFIAGVDFSDYVHHDYAVRHLNPRTGDYEFRPIVRRGTVYPTRDPVARVTVKASHHGQAQLGLAVFELAEGPRPAGELPLELVFDPSGAARMTRVTAADEERRRHSWVNEQNPTFLEADPPAEKGEARFEVEFGIDANKRLLVTARDLRTRRMLFRDFPVVKLT